MLPIYEIRRVLINFRNHNNGSTGSISTTSICIKNVEHMIFMLKWNDDDDELIKTKIVFLWEAEEAKDRERAAQGSTSRIYIDLIIIRSYDNNAVDQTVQITERPKKY